MKQHVTPLVEQSVFEAVSSQIPKLISERVVGSVSAIRGMTIAAIGLPVPIGARCLIRPRAGAAVEAEVVGLRDTQAILSAFCEPNGVSPGDPVECLPSAAQARVGFDLLGRVIDGRGCPLDHAVAPLLNLRYPLYRDAPAPFERARIDQPLSLGVRSIDALLTAGRGQRLGIFAGTGVGKSVLMGTICRHTSADVNVIALIGERGREVGDFVRTQLGPDGLARSVVIACTSDEAPTLRVSACFLATAIAEFFRDQNLNVLLMMDSITRLAMAQRQIGLAAGEAPTSKGYPPSVYSLLPRLLERAGRTHSGSITGVYTVLVEGDDIGEPLADAVRGILDGHIWLSRSLAARGHYPAVDVLNSISRVMDDVVDEPHLAASAAVRRVLATWSEIEDLVSIGAYVKGANAEYDTAVRTRDAVQAFLRQPRGKGCTLEQTRAELLALGARIQKAE
ncbi:MAG: FliI/YscN family ATPase [Phycisphaerales bacterium]|nr:FliI/YscN family ATPase [Phycisphaerales bacterium]